MPFKGRAGRLRRTLSASASTGDISFPPQKEQPTERRNSSSYIQQSNHDYTPQTSSSPSYAYKEGSTHLRFPTTSDTENSGVGPMHAETLDTFSRPFPRLETAAEEEPGPWKVAIGRPPRGVVPEDSSSFEDGPSPQERQKSQDLVAAWLDTSLSANEPSIPPESSRQRRRALMSMPEMDEEDEENVEGEEEADSVLALQSSLNDFLPNTPVRQALRTLDSISEDEVPDFVGSTVSTAPSTPMLPQIARSRSRSPPLRRRSLEIPSTPNSSLLETSFHLTPMRGLDTIDESERPDEKRRSPSSLTSPLPVVERERRSFEGLKLPLILESIPEVDTTNKKELLKVQKRTRIPITSSSTSSSGSSSSTNGQFGLRSLGLMRSESEPAISTSFMARNFSLHSKRKTSTPPALAINTFNVPTLSSPKPSSAPRSPSLPTFQRGTNLIMGQRGPPLPSSNSSSFQRHLSTSLYPPSPAPSPSPSPSPSPLPSPLRNSRTIGGSNPTRNTRGRIASHMGSIEDEE